jgi:putative transcriptional regulator
MGADDDFDRMLQGLTDALAEPDGQTSPQTQPVSRSGVYVPDAIDVTAIRRKTGLSQVSFASRIGVPVGTLRNWEQGHRSPQGPARVLLALLDRNPRIVEETLAD